MPKYRMYVAGVSLDSPWWGAILARAYPPTTPNPTQMTTITVSNPQIVKADPGLTPNATSTGGDTGLLDHVSPVMGVLGLIIVAGMRLHPVTAITATVIGVGIAVINWGSAPAGDGQSGSSSGTVSGGGGGF